MKKKTLNEKINDVVFWLVVFFILYIVVVFLLETSFLTKINKFCFKDTHKLINEALTLTAYFSAPVAAFVLFSDWRVQHVEKSLEIEISNISQEYQDIINNWFFNFHKVTDGDCFDEASIKSRGESNSSLISRTTDAIQLVGPFCSRSENVKGYEKDILKGLEEIKNLILELSLLDTFKEKQSNPKKYNVEYIGESDSDFSSRMECEYEAILQQIMEKIPEIYEYQKMLSELSKNLKIKSN